ncbi:MAG TPA: D-glycerate dehydrogenase [Candidatus Taylorbacteria bacterium]|nr:MAG: D-isomer specific 2-hydroxyacid dehydrogenase, NAD-binding protein [Parcubacteria group bacterium GW2011_GWC2_48_17]HBV00890.1 D-glycerate dehydrogenase [Candidatus Taylorbacteria bacterium]
MPKLVYITRKIPELGLRLLQEKGIEIDVSPKDRPLTKRELIRALQKKSYDGVLSLLTDTIDTDIFDAAPSIKIVANYAVGFNNIDVAEAKKRGITVTNTPGALTEAVAEHTIALMLSLVRRVVESDVYLRTGKFKGWGPELFLGDELMGRTLGILGAGRIGGRVSDIAKKGLGMSVIYYDVKRSEEFEKSCGAKFRQTPEEVLREADVVSIHVPLLPETRHFITQARLALMKKTAYLINTSRGPVIDEDALAGALRAGVIRGAALDVFEYEPKLAKGLAKLSNVVLTPHIASATTEARLDMARMAAENIIAALEGKTPPNLVS